jgi:hypothetical protein
MSYSRKISSCQESTIIVLVALSWLHCPGCIELLAAAVIALGAEYCQGSKDGIQFMQWLGIAAKIYIL